MFSTAIPQRDAKSSTEVKSTGVVSGNTMSDVCILSLTNSIISSVEEERDKASGAVCKCMSWQIQLSQNATKLCVQNIPQQRVLEWKKIYLILPLPGIKEFSPGEIAVLCLGFSPIIIKCNSISNL